MIDLLGDAADQGATLVVFPECFVSLYPTGAWAGQAADVVAGVRCAVGADVGVERRRRRPRGASASPRPAPNGACTSRSVSTSERTCGRARSTTRCSSSAPRACSTATASSCRRCTSGCSTAWARATTSASSSCPAAAGSAGSSAGRTGCRSPAGRVYQGGPQIWVAPTADDSEGWIASMRHIAIEAGAFVVSVPQYIVASAFPDDFPLPLPDGVDVVRTRRGVRGGARRRGGRRAALRRGGHRRRRLRPPARRCTPSATSTWPATTAGPTSSTPVALGSVLPTGEGEAGAEADDHEAADAAEPLEAVRTTGQPGPRGTRGQAPAAVQMQRDRARRSCRARRAGAAPDRRRARRTAAGRP